MATVASFRLISYLSKASLAAKNTPRPVAAVRPTDPPSDRGFAVMTPGVILPVTL